MKNLWFAAKMLTFSLLFYQAACASGTRAGSTVPFLTASPADIPSKETPVLPETVTTPVATWTRITPLHEWVLPNQTINDINWSPTSDKFVIVTYDSVTMYEVNTYQTLWSIAPVAPAYYASAAAFSLDGQSLVVYAHLIGLQMLDAETSHLLAETPKHNYPYNCFPSEASNAILSLDGRRLFVSIDLPKRLKNYAAFSEIHIWDTLSLECADVLVETEGHARSLDLSFDGKYLAFGAGLNTSLSKDGIEEDGQITVRNLEIGQRACSIGHQGSFAHFRPASSVLLVTDPKKDRLVYWDVTRCDEVGELMGVTTSYDFAFSPDGRLLAIWKGDILIVDANSGNVIQKLSDPVSNNVFPIDRLVFGSLLFSPDGRYLLYAIRREPMESLIFLWRIEK